MKRNNVNVLITGGLGFIGWNLARFLLSTGKCNVNILDKEKFRGRHFIKDENEDNLFVADELRTQDLTPDNKFDIEYFYTEDGMYLEPPDVIFHFAEYSRVEKSLESKEEFYKVLESNVTGTGNIILRYLKNVPDTLFFYAGSSTRFSYPGACMQSPYAFTKFMNAELIKSLNRWFGVNTGILYFYNVFGHGERSDDMGTVVEKFKKRYYANEKIDVYGGEQTRRFTYIGDVVANVARLMFSSLDGGCYGKEYHMVSEDVPEVSICKLANMFYDDDMINYYPMKAGCRMSSINDIDLRKVNTYGEYKIGLKDYLKFLKE